MTIHKARIELREAWDAVPFDYRRAARAVAILLELCDYDVTRLRGPYLVIDNDRSLP